MDPTGLAESGNRQKARQSVPRRYDGVSGNPLYEMKNNGHYGRWKAEGWAGRVIG